LNENGYLEIVLKFINKTEIFLSFEYPLEENVEGIRQLIENNLLKICKILLRKYIEKP
jgi:hypothetical protein